MWASGPDGQSLISGEGFVTFNDPVAFGTLRQMFADFDVPEGKEVVWKTNGATLTDDTVISTDTVIWAELVDVEEPPATESFSVWASGPDGQSLISGEGFVTFNDPVAFGTLRQMFADFDVPEGKEVVWKTNGATLTDDTVISTDTVIWAELVDVEEPEPEQRYITVHLYDGDEFIRDVVVLNNSSNWSGVLDAPTKDGYTFVGWQQDGASDIMTDLESVVISADDQVSELTFRAVWEKDVDPYEGYITVNYYDGDELLGTGAVKNGTNEWSGVDSPTKDGYVFDGWNFEGDTERLYKDLSTVRYTGDETVKEINLYANWTKIEDSYADYINVNYWDGEELLGTGAVKRGTSEWSGPTSPSKDGYSFLGWTFEGETLINPDLSKVVMGADETVTEINLYANWDEVSDPYEGYITVNYYDGDELLGTGAVLNGTNEWSGIANPTKDGYVFDGWNFEGDTEHLYKDLSTVRYAGDETVKEINLYANWTKIEDSYADYINVNYWDGEELLGTGAVKNGTTEWSGVVSPSKDGYTFIGWNFEGDTEHLYTDLFDCSLRRR